MLNRIILIGRLTRDPELRYTQSGIAVCTFTLAVDRNYKNAQGERDTDFIDIQVWRQLGENCANYLAKGKLAAVDGSLHIRSYETKDGAKRKATEIVADNVRFLSPRDDGARGGRAAAPPPAATDSVQDELPFGPDHGSGDYFGSSEDDLPF